MAIRPMSQIGDGFAEKSTEGILKAMKAQQKSDKADFKLHCALLLREGVPPADVAFTAWLQGREGLAKRLAAMQPQANPPSPFRPGAELAVEASE